MKPAPEPAQSVQVKAAEFFTPFQLSTKDLDSILLTTEEKTMPPQQKVKTPLVMRQPTNRLPQQARLQTNLVQNK